MTTPQETPADLAPKAATWQELSGRISACTACAELAATRTHVVVGVCPPGADVLLVGEAPGAQEDAEGIPFVGRAGRLLDELLAEAGLPRDRIAVANVLKCRPPGNRKPTREETQRCRPWLSRQIALIGPRVICLLGGTAAAWALGGPVKIGEVRGRPIEQDGRTLVVTYHPSAAIRFGPQGAPRAALREDLRLVAELARPAEAGAGAPSPSAAAPVAGGRKADR